MLQSSEEQTKEPLLKRKLTAMKRKAVNRRQRKLLHNHHCLSLRPLRIINKKQKIRQKTQRRRRKQRLELPLGETHESLANIEGVSDGGTVPKEESLVEISFEDVPEDQQITEAEGETARGRGFSRGVAE